jgi:hypothetical protein
MGKYTVFKTSIYRNKTKNIFTYLQETIKSLDFVSSTRHHLR